MKKITMMLASVSLAGMASVAIAQTPNYMSGGQGSMANGPDTHSQMMPPGQVQQPQAQEMQQPMQQPMQPPSVAAENEPGTVGQRYYPVAQVGNGMPGNTGRGGPDTGGYGAPMYGSSQSGPPAATPLLGAPKN